MPLSPSGTVHALSLAATVSGIPSACPARVARTPASRGAASRSSTASSTCPVTVRPKRACHAGVTARQCDAVTATATEPMRSSPPPYLPSVELAPWVMVAPPASTPVTVIVLAWFHSPGVNVTVAGVTAAFPGVPLMAVTSTSAIGLLSSTTV